MNEIKSSIKRTYTRVTVLGSVVAFAAIAIAQGQKGKTVGETSVPHEVAASVAAEARPIPLTGSPTSAASAVSPLTLQVRTAAVEMPVSDAPATGWEQSPASDSGSSLEPPPLLPDEPYERLENDASPDDTPSIQRQNPYRTQSPANTAFAQPESAPEPMEPLRAAEPGAAADPLPDDPRAALPEDPDARQPLDEPPQLPEPAFDSAPAASPDLMGNSTQGLDATSRSLSPEPAPGPLDGTANRSAQPPGRAACQSAVRFRSFRRHAVVATRAGSLVE